MRFHRYSVIALFIAFAPLARGQLIESLHTFDGTNGSLPSVDLLEAPFDSFFGTTFSGGVSNLGTVFRIGTNGMMAFPISFTGSNGSHPTGNLVYGPGNYVYGTTQTGGASNAGTVFKTSGHNQVSLFSFAGTNGASPMGLVTGFDGYIYGTTAIGGISNRGTIFRFKEGLISPGGGSLSLTNLYHFTVSGGPRPLMQAADGDFYGTTSSGGDADLGTVFKMTSNGVFTTLASFTGTNGAFPWTALVPCGGDFYGTTTKGGGNDGGTVFRMDAAGNITTLASFNFTNTGIPTSLMLASDGNFYGTTASDPYTGGHGTIFTMTPNGNLTRLATFNGSNGSGPNTKLIEKEGFLYGTTRQGGTSYPGAGTVYRIAMPMRLHSRMSGNELVLSWPTNALGFTLQSAADLISPAIWVDFTNAPAIVGAQFTVTNSFSESARFYRLKKR